MKIETERLYLVACDQTILQKAIDGDSHLAEYLKVFVPENWTVFGERALQHSLTKLVENDTENGWWSYLVLEKNENKLIGLCGYKGQPTQDGIVEIGYEIMPEYQNKRLATEVANALVANAFSLDKIVAVQAHTLGAANASTKILEHCDFKKIDEVDGGELGTIWKWHLQKT